MVSLLYGSEIVRDLNHNLNNSFFFWVFELFILLGQFTIFWTGKFKSLFFLNLFGNVPLELDSVRK
jgi:hypothetical protein